MRRTSLLSETDRSTMASSVAAPERIRPPRAATRAAPVVEILMSRSDIQIMIFTRYPEPGVTKTRLIGTLGAQGAAELQRAMTEHVLSRARETANARNAVVKVMYDGGDERLMSLWLDDDLVFSKQGTGDLGERMARAFAGAFGSGSERSIIVGADCPEITPGLIGEALDALAEHDLVLGPASDGGYYLIGLKAAAAELFRGPAWGSDSVLETTLGIARGLGLKVHILRELSDVDRPEDLTVWERATAPGADLISVIIPALNEAENIGRAIETASRAWKRELIVVDGGSADATVSLAREYGATVIETSSGRATQMNAGAEAAKGNILLFLHADSGLPDGYDEHVRRLLGKDGAIAGAFQLRIDAPGLMLRLVEFLANRRSRWLRMPYGDQGLFMRKATFFNVGRFPEMPLMEDYELVRRLRRLGRIAIAPAEVTASARRWIELGVLKTTLLNQFIILSYRLGVPPERLAKWYYKDGNTHNHR